MTVHSGSSNQMLFKKGECPGLLVRGGDSSLSDWFASARLRGKENPGHLSDRSWRGPWVRWKGARTLIPETGCFNELQT